MPKEKARSLNETVSVTSIMNGVDSHAFAVACLWLIASRFLK